MKLFILIMFSFISFVSSASKRDQELETLKNSLQEHQGLVINLKSRLRSLEKDLGRNNNLYIQKVSRINQLEDLMLELVEKLHLNKKRIKHLFEGAEQTYADLIMTMVDQDPLDLAHQEIRMNELIQLMNILKLKLDDNYKLEQQLAEMKKQTSKLKDDERAIYQLISDMRTREEKLKDVVVRKVTIAEQLNRQVSKLQIVNQNLKKKQIITKFAPPLKRYNNFYGEQMGLNFLYSDPSQIYATRSGSIAYVGELASYGTVVMVDHGNDIRTVFLGEIEPYVSKGQKVSEGQILGKALCLKKNSEHSLYFEVRKKNIAQNTIDWLDKKKL